MTVIYEGGYTLPSGDMPLSHARIAHAGNWLSGGTVSAVRTAPGYFVEGPTNVLTFEKWNAGGAAGSWANWVYDHGTAAECDYCAVAAHTLGTELSTFRVQSSTDGITWDQRLPLNNIITSNEPIFAIFEPVTARYWRISMENPSDIGVVKFGKAMQMQVPMAFNHAPGRYQRDTKIENSQSETGEFLGQTVRRSALDTSYEWSHLTRQWVDNNWLPFTLAAERDPFFIAWRPDKYGDCLYGRATESPEASHMGLRAYMQASVKVRGHAYE